MPVQIMVRLAMPAWADPGYAYGTGRAALARRSGGSPAPVQHEDREQSAAGQPEKHSDVVLEEVGVVLLPQALKEFQVAIMWTMTNPTSPAGEGHQHLGADGGIHGGLEECPGIGTGGGFGRPSDGDGVGRGCHAIACRERWKWELCSHSRHPTLCDDPTTVLSFVSTMRIRYSNHSTPHVPIIAMRILLPSALLLFVRRPQLPGLTPRARRKQRIAHPASDAAKP